MKRVLITVAIAWFLIGCQSQETKLSTPIDYRTKLPSIGRVLDSFYTNTRGWNNNEETRKDAVEKINQIFIKRGVQGLYDSVPFKFDQIVKTNDKKFPYMGSFVYEDSYGEITPNMKYYAQIFGLLGEKAKDTLSQGSVFYIKGKSVYVKDPVDYIYQGCIQLPSIRMEIKSLVRAKYPTN